MNDNLEESIKIDPIEGRIKLLDAVIEKNKKSFTELIAMGGSIDPSTLVTMRMNMLLDEILTREEIIDFNIKWEVKMTELLEYAKTEIRKAKLLQGSSSIITR